MRVRAGVFVTLVALSLAAWQIRTASQAASFDLLIRNGRIVDGTGSPWFLGDVGIKANTIVAIDRRLDAGTAHVIDASGLVVAPGFIDVHSHGEARDDGQDAIGNPGAENDVRQGVTTILCGCDPIMPVFLTGEMNRSNYFPEFVIVGTALTDTDIVGQLWNQEFAKHAFGVSSLTEPLPANQSIGYAAYKTVRQDEPAFSVDLIYYQMAQMAAGLQMAGPNLTPESFEAGMFSYPPKLGPAGQWGYGEHDYTAADDVREIYWDPNAISKYNQKQGAFVETDHKRYTQGNIPAGDPQIPVPQ